MSWRVCDRWKKRYRKGSYAKAARSLAESNADLFGEKLSTLEDKSRSQVKSVESYMEASLHESEKKIWGLRRVQRICRPIVLKGTLSSTLILRTVGSQSCVVSSARGSKLIGPY